MRQRSADMLSVLRRAARSEVILVSSSHRSRLRGRYRTR
ncbi:hypothetical protein ABH940_005295 [Streptacidiphilus sp. BW17]